MFSGNLPPASNKATWAVNYELTDEDTGELLDLSGVDQITIEVRDPESRATVLSGSLTGGEVSVPDTGVFRWEFTAAQMRTLCSKTYEVGCTLTENDETIQLIIGRVPVLDGVVT